jgi:hypothetical protein
MVSPTDFLRHMLSPAFVYAALVVAGLGYLVCRAADVARAYKPVGRLVLEYLLLGVAMGLTWCLSVYLLGNYGLRHVVADVGLVYRLAYAGMGLLGLWQATVVGLRPRKDPDATEMWDIRLEAVLSRLGLMVFLIAFGVLSLAAMRGQPLLAGHEVAAAGAIAVIICLLAGVRLLPQFSEHSAPSDADIAANRVWVVGALVSCLLVIGLGWTVRLPIWLPPAVGVPVLFALATVLAITYVPIGAATLAVTHSSPMPLVPAIVPSVLTVGSLPAEFAATMAYVSRSVTAAAYAAGIMAALGIVVAGVALANVVIVRHRVRAQGKEAQRQANVNSDAGAEMLRAAVLEPGIEWETLRRRLLAKQYWQWELGPTLHEAERHWRWLQRSRGRVYATEWGRFIYRIGAV